MYASSYCHFISLEPWGKSRRPGASAPVEGRVSGADQRRLRGRGCSITGGSAARARGGAGAVGAGWWGRGGGGGGGGISSLCELLDSPADLEGCWVRWVLEPVRVCVRWVWVGVGVRARQTSPSMSCRHGRPYSCEVLWGQQEDQPRSCTKNGYSTKTFSNSYTKPQHCYTLNQVVSHVCHLLSPQSDFDVTCVRRNTDLYSSQEFKVTTAETLSDLH